MDDEKIIELYWQRNECAVTETYEKYSAYCGSISLNILKNKEDAEECVNDTLKKAWDSIPPNRPHSLKAFLGRIARNLSLNRLKSYSAEKRGGGQADVVLSELDECIPDKSSVEAALSQKELYRCVNAFVTELPQEKRRIFVERYWYMRPIKELAPKYGMSEGKIKSMLFKMRKQLKLYLEKEGVFYEK